MKKIFFSFGTLFVLLFCVMLIKWTLVELFYAEPTIMQTIISPDGEYTAYLFESNGGSTTGWTYRVSILKTGKQLSKGNGNIYISPIPPAKIEWLDRTTLYVDDYDSVRTTKRKVKIYNVTVVFNSCDK